MPSSPPRFRSPEEELLLRERPDDFEDDSELRRRSTLPLELLLPRERPTLPEEELPRRCGLVLEVERGEIGRRRSTEPRLALPVRMRMRSTVPRTGV